MSKKDFIVETTGSPPIPKLPGQWKPTVVEALEAKAALLNYFSSDRSAVRGPSNRWDEHARRGILARIKVYWLQYIGARGTWASDGGGKPDPAGSQTIIIAGFCKVPPEWRDHLRERQLIVMDGGDCYFRAYYSLSERKIVWFDVNGSA